MHKYLDYIHTSIIFAAEKTEKYEKTNVQT